MKTLKYKSNILFQKFQSYLTNTAIKLETNSTRFGIDISIYQGIEKMILKLLSLSFLKLNTSNQKQ